MPKPTPGQKTIPLNDWNRFLRVADWFERTIEHGKGVLRPTYGQALIVKTPEGGIKARIGDTIYSATCIRCIAAEAETAGEKTIHETDEELLVYNLDTSEVPGDSYVKTNLTANGTRYAEICICSIQCANCENGLAPLEWAVSIDGIANNPCTDCVDMNQTYILPQLTSCQWRISGIEPQAICRARPYPTDSMAMLVRVFKDGSDYKISVQIYQESPLTSFLKFEKNYGTTKPTCISFSGESIPWVSSQFSWNGCESLNGVATCLIAAV